MVLPVPKHMGISLRTRLKCKAARASQTGYIVQAAGKTFGGFHQTYAEALQTLCAAKGVSSVSELKLKPEFRKLSAKRKKHGQVPYVRQRAKYGQWYCPQVALGKSFSSQAEAKRALLGSDQGKTFLSGAKKKMSQETIVNLAPRKLAHRIQCLARFAFGSRRRKWLPADAHAAERHRVASCQMYQCDRVLHFISLVLKYGPWKDALLEQWKLMSKKWPALDQPLTKATQSAESMTSDSEFRLDTANTNYKQALELASPRAKAHLCLLAATAKAISKQPVDPAWSANANRFGGRFNGPVALLH